MINKQITLISPKTFKSETNLIDNQNVIIKPKYLSICQADLRYYNGNRPKEILKNKLPLILIHEGIGEVIYSNNINFNIGDSVCLIPILKNKSTINDYNYDYLNTLFMSSNINGFLQKYIQTPNENLIKIKESKPQYATFEVGSVIMQSIRRLRNFGLQNFNKIAIIGTGSMAFWSALLYKEIFNCKIDIIGNHIEKLEKFDFVDGCYLFNEFENKYDLIIEAVGYNSDIIFDKAIKNLNNLGILLVLGINEKLIQINMRKIMEKGITIISSHRSIKDDFINCINLVENSKYIQNHLTKIISELIKAKNLSDINLAFKKCKNNQFKTIISMEGLIYE